jgi:hypothetical protein
VGGGRSGRGGRDSREGEEDEDNKGEIERREWEGGGVVGERGGRGWRVGERGGGGMGRGTVGGGGGGERGLEGRRRAKGRGMEKEEMEERRGEGVSVRKKR